MLRVQGYRATRTAEDLTIHNVPIFCTCTRGELEFDAKWVRAAVSKAQQLERETGYLPPLHIRHHEAGTAVRAAGYFRVLGTEPLTLKGEERTAIMADLVITDPATIAEVLARRLPYRSVEIFDVGSPEINSLALLDHEAPFLQLPMLMVSAIDDAVGLSSVADATFSVYGPRDRQPALAYFRRGKAAQMLFREGYEMEEDDKKDEPTPQAEESPEKPEAPEEQQPEEAMQEEPEAPEAADVDVGKVIKAIQDGSIAVGDLDALLQAIQAIKSTQSPEEEAPAQVPVPGGAQMKSDHVKMAALEGEVVALRAQLDGMKAATERREAVAVAMKRLEGRPLGANIEKELTEYHEKHGALAFKAHVDAIAKTFGVLPEKDFSGATSGNQFPEVAMKYQSQGTGAVEKAAKFARQWEELREHGLVPVSQERYIEIHMARAASRAR